MAPSIVVTYLICKKCFGFLFKNVHARRYELKEKVKQKIQSVSVHILLVRLCPFPLYCEVPTLLKVSCRLNYRIHDVTMNQRLKVSLLFSKAYQNRE